ncbi:MAG: TIM barrel protein [Capsulimonadaceae bacterium]|nr:TIM barrel protein [Capsulimonadaceae bacterium]
MQYMLFSKHIAGYSPTETARRLRAIGLDAIDLTVRPGGHVEPERVEDDLPAYVSELAREGVRVGMITTNIVSATDRVGEKVLRCAASCGIHYYKLGYFNYQGFGTLREQRIEIRAKMRELAQLNQGVGIRGGYHNHSDAFIGASLSDIDFILDGTHPKWLGLYFDPAHAVIEGGSAGWLMGLDLHKDRLSMVAVKDFYWSEGEGYAGGRRFHVRFAPLAEGNVPWLEVLGHLKEIGFNGPVSFHSEYQGSHSFRDLTTDQVFDQTARDLELFRSWTHEIG